MPATGNAAAAARELREKQKRDIERDAIKAIDVMEKQVDDLDKSDYHKFKNQLSRQAFTFNWPNYILDLSDNGAPDQEARNAMGDRD